MKRFYKSINYKLKDKVIIVIIFIIFFDIMLFNIFIKRLSVNIVNISKAKIKEISTFYLNKTLKKFLNYDVNDYIKLNINNNNIYSIDIDNKGVNKLLKKIINDLEKNVETIVSGRVDYYNMEMLENNDGFIMFIPIGIGMNNALFITLGPKIPIKLNFLQNISAYVDVIASNYGINNTLIKIYIIINMEQVIEMPIDSDKENMNYKFLLSSKLINGKVPNVIGTNLTGESNVVKSNVN